MLHHYLTKATSARFGDPVYPHAFRKCLATTVAISNPSAIAIAATALGHRPTTNEAWYNMAGSVSAFGLLNDAIEAELRNARSRSRLRRRPSRLGHPSWASNHQSYRS
jgi:hypothetical protein